MNTPRTHRRPVRITVGALLLAVSALALPLAAAPAPAPADAADVAARENFQKPPSDALTQAWCDVYGINESIGFIIGVAWNGAAAPAGLEYLVSTNQPNGDQFDLVAKRNPQNIRIEKLTDYQFKVTTLEPTESQVNAIVWAEGIRRTNEKTTLTITGPNDFGGTDELTWSWENTLFSCRADLDRVRS